MYLLEETALLWACLGWKRYDKSTEDRKRGQRHVDGFLFLPMKAGGMNLPSGLKPLK